MKRWQTKEQLKDLLVKLIEIPSVTGSDAEIAMSEYIHLRLADLNYFKTYPHMLELHPTDDGRKLVTALVKKGDAKKTVILLSHFDVVDVEDFGEWKNLAFRPEELTIAFGQEKGKVPDEVQKDIENGNWLFGRGSMDMKAGLTLQMSLIEEACAGRFDGNLLLLSVPDEEANSLGMRTAAGVLLDLAERYHLDYTTLLNAEPSFARYPGDQHKYIYTGSVGKILPGFFCYGQEAHVGEPYSGLNANYMVSEITKLMELNTDFSEMVDDEVTPPPTNLMQKDLKDDYSVQIPNTAVTLFNLLTLEQPLEDINEQLRKVADQATEHIEDHYFEQANKFSQWTDYKPDPMSVRVMTFEELTNEAIALYGRSEIERREAYILANFNELGDRDLSTRLVFDLASLCKHLAPMVVMFYSPPFYPAISSKNVDITQTVLKKVMAYADSENIGLAYQNYFAGLSDLSYAGLPQGTSSLNALFGNMPLYGKRYSLPIDALKALDLPVLNLGPYGKDAHKWTERLDIDYSFETLPPMLKFTVDQLLK
ncbi:arginine utilization protein RocB [Scopulibacillus darangshiensis]|uniref:Arginine utilization protein RocB n=1 Tax=Scopulibacillus darangshiensis TaxID=442528 RepID=A0A4R2PA23_9BACL|nr:M20/M25/M40 family metallo-hydrolase [Scopulibacillus darangshiensis]TCP31787.1 arginine utilization protein RocB [Scopulibacillus darangshiensis]